MSEFDSGLLKQICCDFALSAISLSSSRQHVILVHVTPYCTALHCVGHEITFFDIVLQLIHVLRLFPNPTHTMKFNFIEGVFILNHHVSRDLYLFHSRHNAPYIGLFHALYCTYIICPISYTIYNLFTLQPNVGILSRTTSCSPPLSRPVPLVVPY